MLVEIQINLYAFFKGIFPKLKHFQVEGFRQIASAVIKGGSLKICEISRNLEGDMPYKSKRNKVERFLNNKRITVSVLQKLYIQFLFSFFGFRTGKKIEIVVDYTDFLGYRLLYGGIPFQKRLFPVYFKMFSIKKKGYSLKNIETDFIRTLRTFLPYEYLYIIVADRGFGNETFIEKCKNVGFYFVVRVKGSLYASKNNKKTKISNIRSKHSRSYNYKNHTVNIVITEKNGAIWYLFTNLNDLRAVKKIYEKRFWTEEYFRDIKTYFKARELKYSMEILKRLLFIGQICYNFIFKIGLKEKIDTKQYSNSGVSFFPESFFCNPIFLQKIS